RGWRALGGVWPVQSDPGNCAAQPDFLEADGEKPDRRALMGRRNRLLDELSVPRNILARTPFCQRKGAGDQQLRRRGPCQKFWHGPPALASRRGSRDAQRAGSVSDGLVEASVADASGSLGCGGLA